MEKKQFSGTAIIKGLYSDKLLKLWEKNNMRRIYINRDDGKKSYGYIDLNNDSKVVCDSSIKCDMEKIAKEFLDTYEI